MAHQYSLPDSCRWMGERGEISSDTLLCSLFPCPQTWVVRPMQVHKRERVFFPLPFHDLWNSSIGSDPFEDSRPTARGCTPRYPAISAVDKPSTPLSTPIRRVRARLRGVCRNRAVHGIPPASSAAAAAIAVRLTPSCFGVHSPVKPSSMKR